MAIDPYATPQSEVLSERELRSRSSLRVSVRWLAVSANALLMVANGVGIFGRMTVLDTSDFVLAAIVGFVCLVTLVGLLGTGRSFWCRRVGAWVNGICGGLLIAIINKEALQQPVFIVGVAIFGTIIVLNILALALVSSSRRAQ